MDTWHQTHSRNLRWFFAKLCLVFTNNFLSWLRKLGSLTPRRRVAANRHVKLKRNRHFKINMTNTNLLLSITLFFLYGKISAQMLEGYESSTIHIEAKKGLNKKIGIGYFFGLTSEKDKSSYSEIVVNKDLIIGSENIQLHYKKEKVNESDEPEIYVHTIPNSKEYVFIAPNPENKLAFIHMGKIYGMLEKKGVSTSEVYMFPDYIEMLQIPILDKDLAELKTSWEKK